MKILFSNSIADRAYLDIITDKLIEVFKNHANMMPYFDIPIQHSSNYMLESMKRSGTREKYLEVIGKIKTQIPNAILRTTLIVGFPGETEEDFEDLKDFISKVEFDHLGVFAFSDEEDTLAYEMENKIDPKIAKQREKEIMKFWEENSIFEESIKKNEGNESSVEEGFGILGGVLRF